MRKISSRPQEQIVQKMSLKCAQLKMHLVGIEATSCSLIYLCNDEIGYNDSIAFKDLQSRNRTFIQIP